MPPSRAAQRFSNSSQHERQTQKSCANGRGTIAVLFTGKATCAGGGVHWVVRIALTIGTWIRAGARLTFANPARFDYANARTAVAARGIAVITTFDGCNHTVAAFSVLTNRRRTTTRPAVFHDAGRIAPVAVFLIAVVALFITSDKPVTTFGCAHHAITVIPIVACARKGTGRIGARGMLVAIVCSRGAFVDIGTRHAIAFVTRPAAAIERSRRIGTRGVGIAVIGAQNAFVDIRAGDAVTFVSRVARAIKGPGVVHASGIGIAIMRAQNAFVDVAARHAIAIVPGIACAIEVPRRIRTGCIDVAIVGVLDAFVNIGARDAVAFITRQTHAGKRSRHVHAIGIRVAIVGFRVAFIDISARHTHIHAFITRLHHTRSGAAIATGGISVVAQFAHFDEAVATYRNRPASHCTTRRVRACASITRVIGARVAVIAVHVRHTHGRTNGYAGHRQIELTTSGHRIAAHANPFRGESKGQTKTRQINGNRSECFSSATRSCRKRKFFIDAPDIKRCPRSRRSFDRNRRSVRGKSCIEYDEVHTRIVDNRRIAKKEFHVVAGRAFDVRCADCGRMPNDILRTRATAHGIRITVTRL